jgi:hypothetical protein
MKIEEAFEIFETAEDVLGYPACFGCVDGVVAVADGGHNSLAMYREADFIAWMKAAKDGFVAHEFDSWFEAVNETRIPPAGRFS